MAKIYRDQKTAKDEWLKLKDEPWKVKLQYIWDYYGIAIVGTILGIAAVISIISGIIYNSIPDIIGGEFYTTYVTEEGTAELKHYLAEKLEVEEKDYNISLVSSVTDAKDYSQLAYQAQALVARISAQELDFLCSEKATFGTLMDKDNEDDNTFFNLATILPKDVYDRLEAEGRFVMYENNYSEPFPYLIEVTDTKLLEMLGVNYRNPLFIGVPINASRLDAFIAMCDLITAK